MAVSREEFQSAMTYDQWKAGWTRNQDRFAAQSHRRAADAWERGAFAAEVVPVTVGSGAKAKAVSRDEGIRPDTTAEGLAKLKASFCDGGTVTAGNASTLSDGNTLGAGNAPEISG